MWPTISSARLQKVFDRLHLRASQENAYPFRGEAQEENMAQRLKILLLDDEPIVGKRLKPALSKLDCEVEVFENPRQALQRIVQKDFDIVVTDIRMDEIDGIRVLDETLKKSPRTKVIMITGYAMMSVAREAMGKGAFDFISNPFSPDELRKVILRAAESLGQPMDFEATRVAGSE